VVGHGDDLDTRAGVGLHQLPTEGVVGLATADIALTVLLVRRGVDLQVTDVEPRVPHRSAAYRPHGRAAISTSHARDRGGAPGPWATPLASVRTNE